MALSSVVPPASLASTAGPRARTLEFFRQGHGAEAYRSVPSFKALVDRLTSGSDRPLEALEEKLAATSAQEADPEAAHGLRQIDALADSRELARGEPAKNDYILAWESVIQRTGPAAFLADAPLKEAFDRAQASYRALVDHPGNSQSLVPDPKYADLRSFEKAAQGKLYAKALSEAAADFRRLIEKASLGEARALDTSDVDRWALGRFWRIMSVAKRFYSISARKRGLVRGPLDREGRLRFPVVGRQLLEDLGAVAVLLRIPGVEGEKLEVFKSELKLWPELAAQLEAWEKGPERAIVPVVGALFLLLSVNPVVDLASNVIKGNGLRFSPGFTLIGEGD